MEATVALTSWPGKRFFDFCFALLFFICASPLYLLIFLLIKLTSNGPVIYKSFRVGQGGALFTCYKFRTMCVDAEEKLQKLLKSDPELQKEWDTFFKLKKDPRRTLFGKFLRKTSLDELPQIWNVLKGDLSIVGPRPLAVEDPKNSAFEIQKLYGQSASVILSAKPGLTCIWQTKGRNLLTFEERIDYEIEYVKRQSLWLDVKIILKTIPVILFPKGAY